jgi:hypothetical protein
MYNISCTEKLIERPPSPDLAEQPATPRSLLAAEIVEAKQVAGLS